MLRNKNVTLAKKGNLSQGCLMFYLLFVFADKSTRKQQVRSLQVLLQR